MAAPPKVSITIPSYNHARFLPATIDSVLAQTYPNVEIIIVDDGSTDGSLEIAAAYAARHPALVRVLTHPGGENRGISATVNRCFAEAAGVYWIGVPSDDLLHPMKVAEQVEFMEQHPQIGWVYGYAYYIDEHGRGRPEFALFGEDITRATDPVERLILGNVVPGMTVLMRRAAVATIEPHDETLVYSDWDFWVRMAARNPVAFLPQTRVGYRVHSYNTSVGVKGEVNMHRAREVMLKLRREAEAIGGGLARPRTQALLDLQLAFFSYAVQEDEQAAQHLIQAFTTDPLLVGDAPYFLRWLKYGHRYLSLMHERPAQIEFAGWVMAHLPAGLDRHFMESVSRGVSGPAFSPVAEKYYRLAAYWEGRRTVLGSLLSDGQAWRDRALFGVHLQALLGSRINNMLSRFRGV
ncbi:MAG: hypothetical protein QOD75_1814 [Blastocatellia bacterium]|jgi:glycosyltransferase involved in cell wall biosynthesis|nr:hypothetical protein [Blastocatellia bacterium]